MALANMDILNSAMNQFYRKTSQLLFFYISEFTVQDFNGGVQATYVVADEDGENKNIYVTWDGESLTCSKFDGFIEGVDGWGKPVKGDRAKNEAAFMSSLNLLLADITAWSEQSGNELDGVTMECMMDKRVSFKEKFKNRGRVYYRFS